jgi:hypothetical protein
MWCSRVGLGSVGSVIFTPSFVRGMKTPSLYQRNKGNKMSQSKFDFNAFNSLVEHKPAGLQIYLAQQLLSNALWSMEKYDNPRQNETRDALNALKTLRTQLKADALARA